MPSVADLNCIILIDEEVKSKMKINIGDLANYGAIIIDDIKLLTEDDLGRTNKVIILGHYKFNGLDELKLFKEVLNLEYYLVTNDRILSELVKSFCNCFIMDYSCISSNMIYSILYNDSGEMAKYKLEDVDLLSEDDIYKILDKTSDEVTRDLCYNYIRLRKLLGEQLKKETSYTSDLRRLDSQILTHIQDNTLLSETLENLVNKVLVQSNTLKSLEIAFTEDFYNNIQTSKFSNRPKVVYFKEYQEMVHENSFIKTLFHSIQNQGKLSCKVVRLHDSYDVLRIKNLEDRYHLVNNKFIESDVVKNDFILSYGNYKKLLEFLLTNKYTLDVLIIIDCKKFEKFYDVVVSGYDVINYNICRNKSFSDKLSLNPVNTIVNNDNSSIMSWNYYPEYITSSDSELSKFLFLSSRPVIKNIYKNIKET